MGNSASSKLESIFEQLDFVEQVVITLTPRKINVLMVPKITELKNFLFGRMESNKIKATFEGSSKRKK